jgi:hypothetical protein
MNTPPENPELIRRVERYQLALTYAQRVATCLSASIEACINDDIEKADYFSRIALHHTMQIKFYLSAKQK